ncbi:MAG: PEP-CTERM sorting domain-containing protein [Kiritimatiellales bacterium]
MKKGIAGLAAGLCFVMGSFADVYFDGSGAITTASNWTNDMGETGYFPTNGVQGWVTEGTGTISGETPFIGWTVTQTGGTVSRAGAVAFNGGALWKIQGGVITSAQHVTVGRTNDAVAKLIVSGDALVTASTNLQIRFNSTLQQTGGKLAFDRNAEFNYGGIADISGGTGTFGGTLNFTYNDAVLKLSGDAAWTFDGNLNIGGSVASGHAVVQFDSGAGSLTVSNITGSGNGYINFASGSEGTLTVTSYDASNFETLWNSGKIKIDNGAGTGNFDSLFDVTGNTLTMIPEPATLSLFLISGLALIVCRRCR